jgi:hypothetical protein
MRENYNGYRFNTNQKEKIYNTTLVIYFLRGFFKNYEIPSILKDRNLKPSELGIEEIIQSDNSKNIIDTLLLNNNYCSPEDINDTIDTKNIFSTDIIDILSFLYYFGSLTLAPLPDNIKKGTNFIIPNKIVKEYYINELKNRLNF